MFYNILLFYYCIIVLLYYYIIATLIISILFAGCQKEKELPTTIQTKEQITSDLLLQFDAKAQEIIGDSANYQHLRNVFSPANSNNYYDSTGIRFAMGLHLFNEEIKKQGFPDNFDTYKRLMQTSVNQFIIPDDNIEGVVVTPAVTQIIKFTNNLMSHVNNYNVKILLYKVFENITVNSLLSEKEKEELLKYFSTNKYLQYTVGNEGIGVPYATDWDDRFNDCMDDKANETFSNPISAAACLANPPECAAVMIVGCAWEATFSD